ncbi:MAG TPA: hypothetical protein EYP92_02550 [Candidatus Thioglobus sp.]|nr:hypothetical protein [Candidatus Thioglobus sp.]HIL42363.1 hypothetical protein [Gammaproteobacteria bacterium]
MFESVLQSWGSDDFPINFKDAIKSLKLGTIPLSDCCNHSAVIDERSIDSVILSSNENEHNIELKLGIFFCEILSGSCCSDDPSVSITKEKSYCEVVAILDKKSAELKFINA